MFRFFDSVLCAASVALLSTVAATASAQQFATYGTLEASGFGEQSAFLGTTVSAGRPGWSPIASLAVYAFQYRQGDNAGSRVSAEAFAPAVGLTYATTTSAIQASVGYVFVNTNQEVVLADAPNQLSATGSPVGNQNSTFVSGQYVYWGDGSSSTQLLGSYSFKGDYLWARGAQLFRVGATSPILLGADVTLQGSTQGSSDYELELGPAFEYRVSPAFRFTGGAGYRTDTKFNSGSGYVRIGFLWLTSPFGH